MPDEPPRDETPPARVDQAEAAPIPAPPPWALGWNDKRFLRSLKISPD